MQIFESLSVTLGLPSDQILLIFCLMISMPIGLIQFAFVRGALFRHFFSIGTGLALALVLYGPDGLIHYFTVSGTVYLMLLLFPRDKIAVPVIAFCLVYQSAMHINRIFTDYMGWHMDATGMQMLMTCKLSLLAYSYQDSEVVKNNPDLVPGEQRKLMIEKLPNIIEFYSFLLFYPSALIGPSFEYLDYLRFVNKQDEFSKIPMPVLESLRVLFISIFFAALTAVGGIYFPNSYVNSEEFANEAFWYKIFFFNCAMVVAKLRYTTAWKFTESSMISTGFGYTVDNKGSSSWKRAVSIEWKKTEYAWTAKEMVENWNISVSVWLRRCIFNRILVSGKDPKNPSATRKSMAQHCSYFLSAVWHGFYPAYYIMFSLFSIHSEISKMVYISNWDWLPAKTFFKWVGWVMMWQIGNFLGLIFLSLDFTLAMRFMASIYYFPVIQLALAWTFFKVTGLHRKKKRE